MMSKKTKDLLLALEALAVAEVDLNEAEIIDSVLAFGKSVCQDIERDADYLAAGQPSKAREIRRQARACIDVIDARKIPPS